jgi:hypothetical protein
VSNLSLPLQGYRAQGASIRAVRARRPERHQNTETTTTHTIHDEEHVWRRHSHLGAESRDSTHTVAFAPVAEHTPSPGVTFSGRAATVDAHRVAIGAGPTKRAVSPEHQAAAAAKQKFSTTVHERIYHSVPSDTTDRGRAQRLADAQRHGTDRPF